MGHTGHLRQSHTSSLVSDPPWSNSAAILKVSHEHGLMSSITAPSEGFRPYKHTCCSVGLPASLPPLDASSSFRTRRKQLPAARAQTEQGGERLRYREGLVGSMHPEIEGAVAVLWLSMGQGCWEHGSLGMAGHPVRQVNERKHPEPVC